MSSKKTNAGTVIPEQQEGKAVTTAAEAVTEKATTTETVKGVVKDVPVKEALYTHQQLIDGCAAFGTNRAIVATALRGNDKKFLTETEAKEIINTFKNKKR